MLAMDRAKTSVDIDGTLSGGVLRFGCPTTETGRSADSGLSRVAFVTSTGQLLLEFDSTTPRLVLEPNRGHELIASRTGKFGDSPPSYLNGDRSEPSP